uniref:SEC1 family transport protein SLY1 n=2 Tax=Oryza brachyantha TaxID=4533 RepID=J3N268_ORYBR
MVAAALDARLRDHLIAKPNLFTEAASTAVASFQRPVLCLFDRNFELSVGIQHDWSYRPLVHDVLGLKSNVLKLPVERYELDDSDTFWAVNSWLQFPNVAKEIEAQLAKYKQDVDEVNQRTGGARDGVEFDGTDLIGNTRHLMNAVNSLPELTERKKLIDKHTNIATALLGHIKERSLDGYCECENSMLVDGTFDRTKLLNLLRGNGTKEDKLRLAVSYLLSFETPQSSDLEQVEAALRESEVDMSAFQYVKRIKSLNSQFAAASSTSKGQLVDWAEKIYGNSIMAMTTQVKNLLSDGRQLAITRTVEALMDGKPNPEVDNYLLFDPRAPKSGSGGQFRGPFREAIVFMIGGGNYIEYRSLLELAQRSQTTKQVIYGVTEILNGVEFIQQLSELGQKAGLGGVSSSLPPQ